MSLKDPNQACDCREELSLANKKAEDIMDQRLGFLSTVSHEIRTPLNAIIGISDLLQGPTDEIQREEYYQILKQTSETLLELVNNVLDFSKIKSGKLQLINKEFNLRKAISRSLYGEKIKARQKGLNLLFQIDPELPEILVGDSVKIGQIFMNLVSNAIKFTEEGEVVIKVEIKDRKASTVSINCTITDTGIGIPKEQMSNIFEAFHQGSEEINIRYAGTGLGLSISKTLIRMLGGELRVCSTEGVGSEFGFSMELAIAEPYVEETPSHSGENCSCGCGLKILLVEDNKINLMVVEKNLENWGVDFDSVMNGKEAIEKVKEKDYDLILMDLQMPVMNGFEAASLIRKLPGERFTTLPIIALTAASEQYYHEEIEMADFTDFVNKPFHPADLLKKINRYGKGKRVNAGVKRV